RSRCFVPLLCLRQLC
ncbi:putative Spectrin alpha chain brain-like protein, partial [Naja naja]